MKIVFSRKNQFIFLKIQGRFFANKFDPKIDYYKVLGLKAYSSSEDIKQSYRSLVRKYHPDLNKHGEAKFKEINQANEVLSDAVIKQDYDSQRKHYFGSSDCSIPKHNPFNETQNYYKNTNKANMNSSNFEDLFNQFKQQQDPFTKNSNGPSTTNTYYDFKGNKYTYSTSASQKGNSERSNTKTDEERREAQDQSTKEFFTSEKFENIKGKLFQEFNQQTKNNKNVDNFGNKRIKSDSQNIRQNDNRETKQNGTGQSESEKSKSKNVSVDEKKKRGFFQGIYSSWKEFNVDEKK